MSPNSFLTSGVDSAEGGDTERHEDPLWFPHPTCEVSALGAEAPLTTEGAGRSFFLATLPGTDLEAVPVLRGSGATGLRSPPGRATFAGSTAPDEGGWHAPLPPCAEPSARSLLSTLRGLWAAHRQRMQDVDAARIRFRPGLAVSRQAMGPVGILGSWAVDSALYDLRRYDGRLQVLQKGVRVHASDTWQDATRSNPQPSRGYVIVTAARQMS